MFEFGVSEETIASLAQSILSYSLLGNEGHFNYDQITEQYLTIYKRLKKEMLTNVNDGASDVA